MSALIIALVVLVLIAIGIVVRLLIAEMAKPAPGQSKTIRKPVGVGAAGAVSPAARVAATAGLATAAPVGAPPGGGVAVATRPDADLLTELGPDAVRPVAPPGPAPRGRTRRARMRDVVERGEGVRISVWRRIRSAVSLLVLVALLGASAAAVVGGAVLIIAFLLQQAIN